MEPDVLPVFYYNDLMVSGLGERIGLNLFEPRYRMMCQRMEADPRFLFVPNFENYECRVGDVGFVIRLTSMRRQSNGCYGIQGHAEELVTVACTWVEPDTQGLHSAHFQRLEPHREPVSPQELRALYGAMVQAGFGEEAGLGEPRLILRHPLDGDGGHALCGLNWPDRCFIMALGGEPGEPGDDRRPGLRGRLGELWTAAARSVQRPRFPSHDFAERFVHQLPPLPRGPRLQDVCNAMLGHVEWDSEAAPPPEGAQLSDAELPWFRLVDPPTWRRLLSPARLCCVQGMSALLPSVRIDLCCVRSDVVPSILPRAGAARGGDPAEVAAVLCNGDGGNVLLLARLSDVQVTEDSAAAAIRGLLWRLGRLRLRILQRARAAGQGPLAALDPNVARLVCDFVAPEPA